MSVISCRSHGTPLVAMWAVLLAVALLSACSKPSEPDRRGRGAGGPVPVTVGKVTSKDIPVELTTFGTVKPHATVDVRSEVGGVLMKSYIQKGQAVKKGDKLFSIDPRTYQASLDQAKANLTRDTAEEANAKQEADRAAELFKRGISAKSDYDKALTAVETSAAAVRADEAAVESAKLQLARCDITSPLDGRAGNIYVDAGNLVKANDVVLVTINQIQPVDVFFSIPQTDLPALKAYMAEGALSVRALIPKEANAVEVGQLTFVDNEIDVSTGTVQLGATFPNTQERLWPGLYVNIDVVLSVLKDAVVTPSSAIEIGRDGKYVFVVKDDGAAEFRPVVSGITSGDNVVITQGLKPGETVVTDGQLRLVDGAKVEIKSAKQEGAASVADSGPAPEGKGKGRGGARQNGAGRGKQ